MKNMPHWLLYPFFRDYEVRFEVEGSNGWQVTKSVQLKNEFTGTCAAEHVAPGLIQQTAEASVLRSANMREL
jgi:hypothetical protein